MSFDPRKIAIDEHKRWMGYLQPEGVVVSPVALVDHGVQLDSSRFVDLQERFTAATVKEAESGAPVIPSFAQFARSFLGWRDDLLQIFAVDAEVPDALRLSTGEFGELLQPDAALKYLAPADPEKPWMLLIRQLPAGSGLDQLPDQNTSSWVASPVQKFERLLRSKEIPIGIISNGTEIRLLYAPRGENSGSLTFPVRFMTEIAGRAVTGALHMLLSHQRLISAPEPARLPNLLKKSRDYQSSVSTALAEQVLEALYELIRGFQAADALQQRALLKEVLQRNPDEVYHGLLTVLLRMVFLLFAEDRGLMPAGALYQDNYSMHGLFKRLHAAAERYRDTMDSRFGAWTQILTVCRLVYHGSRAWDLKMPAREGHLFDADRFPFLEGRPSRQADIESSKIPAVSDGTIYRVLEKLLILDGERLSYRTLDVEQIGSVYQTMIGFTLEVAAGATIALKPAKPKGAPSFIDLDDLLATSPGERSKRLKELTDHDLKGPAASGLKEAQTLDAVVAALDRKIARRVTAHRLPPGTLVLQPTNERRRSGSHYTPRALTAPIVRKTLEPIFARLGEHPTPQQILDLKICDPAVGSGAFLVEACRQLGDALVASWLHHGGKPVIPPDEDELLHARRLVAQRCLYGVDRNPMATDLAKLSLWLATLAKDHPFTFLDHSIRTGDALVGLSKKQIVAFHWDLDAPEVQESQFGQQDIEKAIERANSYRREILEAGDNLSPATKANRLALADEQLEVARRAGDLCIAAFFNGDKKAERKTLRNRHLEQLLEMRSSFKAEQVNAVLGVLKNLREGKPHSVTPFHWDIEFPEVFARGNGGFDAIVGNPPYAGKNTVSEGNRSGYLDWLGAMHEESHGAADLVAHFFRRAFSVLARPGCAGLIATNTISQGDTRATGLRWICTHDGTIYDATRRYRWPGQAAVVVSVVHFAKGSAPTRIQLDGVQVDKITAFLAHHGSSENPAVMRSNAKSAFKGCELGSLGFLVAPDDQEFGRFAPLRDPREPNALLLKPYLGGEDLNATPMAEAPRYVLDVDGLSAEEMSTLPSVQSFLAEGLNAKGRNLWWNFRRPSLEMRSAARKLDRFLVVARVSQTVGFLFIPTNVIPNEMVIVFAFSDYATFGTLQSRIHEAWARFFSGSMKDDLRYTPSDCFETFPFPQGWQENESVDSTAKVYYEFRSALMARNNQGLTATYNRFHDPTEHDPDILKLRQLHAEMDQAVLSAYRWDDLVKEGRCECDFYPDYYEEAEQPGGEPIPCSIRYRWPDATRDEVLARLLKLNAERAAAEKRSSALEQPASSKRGARTKSKKSADKSGVTSAQTELIPSPQTEFFG